MRSDPERLADILDSIRDIEEYARQGKAVFESDRLIQNWIASHLQVMGEACFGLSQKLRAQHPEVPWRKIIGLRHILVHHYFAVNLKIIWSVTEEDLPALKPQIEGILSQLGEPETTSPPPSPTDS